MLRPFITTLHDPELPLPSETTWYEKALTDIEHFSISPQILFYLEQRNAVHQTPVFFQKALKQQANQAFLQNLYIKRKMEQILAAFEEAHIYVIPLKGTHFIETYFGKLSARWTSDIDLLIPQAELSQAAAVVRDLGFTIDEEPIPAHFHLSFSQALPHSNIPLTVELHWGLLQERTSQLSMDEFWAESKPIQTSEYIRELSDYHTFYMICLHGWRHHLNCLKYFIDILRVISVIGPQFDWKRLEREMIRQGTEQRIRKTLSIVYQQFPHLKPVNIFPLTSNTTRWWEYEAIRNHDYKTYKQYANMFCFEFLDFDSPRDRLRKLATWFIPGQAMAAYECKAVGDEDSHGSSLFKLYKQRWGQFAAMISRK
ncbi:hypothetical protein BEP19_13140 [Ammoniphilus oxalaticus]|uniref:Renal dipeptidase n=1 Tax=Ammoniphilus oxalaticus TaxID=66863 RepID=A0A419SH99_9BACL|nr:nucleotidyltransferase family protein [Ammoniphilus oxalaticus]RKD23157.1 hypothetical protein BEP19_13140 [Ammoniphilus oxalaticus]